MTPTSRRLRIIAVTGQFRPAVGGTEIQAARLAAAWAEQGHAVEIWTRRLHASHPTLEMEGGAVVRRLGQSSQGSRPLPFKLEKISFSSSLLFELVARRRQYDVVIVHQALYAALVCAVARRFTGRPLVLRNASTGTTSDFRAWGRFTSAVLGLLKHSTDAVVVTNREGEAEALARGFSPHDLYRIPNGLEAKDPPPARPVGRPVRFAYVGGLRPEKRVDLLLNAWARAGSPGELHIIGDGPLRRSLEAQANERGISPVFSGNIENARSALPGMDVFVLSSDAEGMSNALLEGMAAGCACVGTYVGGNIDCLDPAAGAPPLPGQILKGSAGWLVACGDEAALSLALASLASSRADRDRLGAAARERVVSEFTLEATASAYLKRFEALATRP